MGLVIGIDARHLEFQGDVVTIGRNPSAQISLPDSRLADRHAELRYVAGRWLIEAQGAASIRVADGRPTKVAWLNDGDVIWLTESGPTITFAPSLHGSGSPPSQPVPSPMAVPGVPAKSKSPTPAKSGEVGRRDRGNTPVMSASVVVDSSVSNRDRVTRRSRNQQSAWGIGVALAAVLILLASLLTWPRTKPGEVSSKVADTSPSGPQPVLTSPLDRIDDEPSRPASTSSREEPRAPIPQSPSSAVYLVMLRDPQTDRSSRLGTAWAVANRRLVTTGDVGKRLSEALENRFEAIVRGEGARPPVKVERILLDPEFLSVHEEVTTAGNQLDELWEQWDAADDESTKQTLTPRMDQANTRFLKACQKELSCNLAVLEVADDLAAVLPVPASHSTAARPGSSIRLVGFPVSPQDLLVDPDEPQQPFTREGKVDAKDSANSRWRVRITNPPLENYWFGSPVINSTGQVIGIYSLATPPVQTSENVIPSTHEITSLDRLSRILNPSR